MIATSHVIIGGTVGIIAAQTTNNPITGAAIGLVTGIVSHILGDTLPHLDLPPSAKFIGDDVVWDRNLYIFAICDSLVAFFGILFLWYKFFDFSIYSPFAWGALGGYLPDFIDNFPLWRLQVRKFPILKQFHELHTKIHHNWQRYFPMPRYWILGTLTQVIIVLPCLWWLLK